MTNLLLPIVSLLLVAAAPAPKPAPAASQPLTGNWAGDGFALRTAPTGTIVQGKCASGKISAPIIPDKAGAFTATGYFNPYTSGYRLSDIAPRDQIAYFKGKVSGNTLDLTMRINGKPDAHHILKRNAKITFPKCN